jgi:caffeoyl-CoA O-methyltransferase
MTGPDRDAIRRMNEVVVRDDRVECVMIPVGDGMSIARKR